MKYYYNDNVVTSPTPIVEEEEPSTTNQEATSADDDEPGINRCLTGVENDSRRRYHHQRRQQQEDRHDTDDHRRSTPATAHDHHQFSRTTTCYYSPVYMEPCVKCRQSGVPATRHCVHLVFLISFVLFLIVGVALTCLGFLDYGAGGANAKAFRILGIVALLLCIGFLIAACVILSECVTTAIKQPIDDEYGYHALYPSYSDSFNSGLGDRTALYANCGQPILIPASQTLGSAMNQNGHNLQPVSAVLCASCSCQLLGHITANPNLMPGSVSCPQSIVHFSRDGRVNIASEKTSETASSYIFDVPSDEEDPMHNHEEPREWV